MTTEKYETCDNYTLAEIEKFQTWLDDSIGTEIEVNEADDGKYYIVVFDLTLREVSMCMIYEKEQGR